MHVIIKMYDSNYVMKTIQYIKIGANKYEIYSISKSNISFRILTTGTLTTEAHSSHAKQNQESVNKHDKEALYRYYTGKTMEMKNISALKHGKTTYVLSLEVLRFKFYCLEMIKVNFNSVVMRG